MILGSGSPACKMFWGNVLLISCCVFYLLWWGLAFKTTGAVKGMRSGWLLIPAFFCGVAGVILIVRGANEVNSAASFFPGRTVLLAGVISYIVLFLVTWFVFRRQVTTELLLIVSWAALVFLEVNALYGLGIFTRNGAVGLFAAVILAAALSMICYMLYYGLDARAGYVDGMIPLILAGICMAALAISIARTKS